MNAQRNVAIFRSLLLPISETFVLDQTRTLKDWNPILLGRKCVENGLSISHLRQEIVPQTENTFSHAFKVLTAQPEPSLVDALNRLDVSLVHTHFGTDATEIWPSVRAASLPMVVTLHGFDININRRWWESGRGGLKRITYPRQLLCMARDPSVQFIAVSEAIRHRAIEFGIAKEKISVSYIGVDTTRFSPAGRPLHLRGKRILFVGRMVPKKAPVLMINAFALLRAWEPDAELVMIGDGPLLAQARNVASALKVPVAFLGAQPADVVKVHLDEARLFCLPSITAPNGDAEGFGMVLLEAQACGVPVVSSARGGALEGMIDGVTGFTCPEDSVLELAQTLRIALDPGIDSDSMAAAAVQFVQTRFDLKQHTIALESIYHKASQRANTQ